MRSATNGASWARAFPAATDTSVSGGWPSGGVRAARRKNMVLTLRRIAMAADGDDFAGAAQAYADYRGQLAAAASDLKLAEAWSLVQSGGAGGAFRGAQPARQAGEIRALL